MMRCLLCVLSLLTIGQLTLANPGLKVRVSKKGIEYANKVAGKYLTQALDDLILSDQTGKDRYMSWQLSSIQKQKIIQPVTSLTLNPQVNGLTLGVSNFGAEFSTNFWIKYKNGWFSVSDSGKMNVKIRGVAAIVNVGIGATTEGRVTVRSKSCTSSIEQLELQFFGGSAFLLNMFRDLVQNMLKDVLRKEICGVVNKAIDVSASNALSQMDVTYEVLENFTADCRMLGDAVVTSNYMESSHKGEVYWTGARGEYPTTPANIPALNDVNKMAYIWLTEYSINSFLYSAHVHNFLQYNLLPSEVDTIFRPYFETTCRTYSSCLGALIPQLGSAYPNASVESRFTSPSPPEVRFFADRISVKAVADVALHVHTADGKTYHAVTLTLDVLVNLTASIQDGKINGTLLGHTVDVYPKPTSTATIEVHGVSQTFKNLVQGLINANFIDKASKGVKLPELKDVIFTNMELYLFEGFLVAGSDITYRNI